MKEIPELPMQLTKRIVLDPSASQRLRVPAITLRGNKATPGLAALDDFGTPAADRVPSV